MNSLLHSPVALTILTSLAILLVVAVLLPPLLWLVYESDVWEYPPFSWYKRWNDYWFPY